MTLEKHLLLKCPKRAQYLRVIIMELAYYRSLNGNSILGVDTGAGISICFQFEEI
jgi:NADH-quinone oxidoreductase subunit D